MEIDADTLNKLIADELGRISDVRVLGHIRKLLVEPYMVQRIWDYGEPGQTYPCWMVLSDPKSGGHIGYCEYGFGPRCPWGLIGSGDAEKDQHMGMDSGWFRTFVEAFFESVACSDLPIWRVFKETTDGTRVALTAEGGLEVTWQMIEAMRKSDPTVRYHCDHEISYGK